MSPSARLSGVVGLRVRFPAALPSSLSSSSPLTAGWPDGAVEDDVKAGKKRHSVLPVMTKVGCRHDDGGRPRRPQEETAMTPPFARPHSPATTSTTTLQTAGDGRKKKRISDHVVDDAKARANRQRHCAKTLYSDVDRHTFFLGAWGLVPAPAFCSRLSRCRHRCCFWAPLAPTRTADLQPFASLVFFVGSCSSRRPRPAVRS